GGLVVAVGGDLGGVAEVAPPAEVPLADVRRAVARGPQQARQRGGAWVEEIVLPAAAVAGPGLQETRDLPAAGVAAGQQRAAGRRADRRGGIVLREARAVPRQAVEVGSRGDLAAVAAEVARPQVVGKDDNDVGLLGAG